MARRILITGASIAGNTAAWWLGRSGFDVTVVERAPAFRDGGQNIDVRGVGRTVLRRMGLERAALDSGTGEEGTSWIDGQGRVAARFDVAGSAGDAGRLPGQQPQPARAGAAERVRVHHAPRPAVQDLQDAARAHRLGQTFGPALEPVGGQLGQGRPHTRAPGRGDGL